jgi:DNA repair exonuclease SbcCD nuclease subunit
MDLIISDLHLTDSPLEEYRWAVFDWLKDLKKEYSIDNIFLLGDLTEKKDNHSAKLVNRISEEFGSLSCDIDALYIIRGNHDGIDPDCPFFKFLNRESNNIYYTQPIFHPSGYLFLPHSKDPVNEWQDILKKYIKDTDIIFMHQTIQGAKAGNGFTLDGIDSNVFRDFRGLIFSGDVHTPQQIGNVIYVGSPYPVYFGDDFIGGGVLLDGNDWERIENPTIRRVMLDLDFTIPECDRKVVLPSKGDQYKIKMLVNRSDSDQFDEWKKNLKKHIEDCGGILVTVELKLAEEKSSRLAKKRTFKNLDPVTILKRHCRTEGLDSYYEEKGREFL